MRKNQPGDKASSSQVPQTLDVHMEEIQEVEITQVKIVAPWNKMKHDPVEEYNIKFKFNPMWKGSIEVKKTTRQRAQERKGEIT